MKSDLLCAYPHKVGIGRHRVPVLYDVPRSSIDGAYGMYNEPRSRLKKGRILISSEGDELSLFCHELAHAFIDIGRRSRDADVEDLAGELGSLLYYGVNGYLKHWASHYPPGEASRKPGNLTGP